MTWLEAQFGFQSIVMTSLLKTGQIECYDTRGVNIPCAGTGQDGALQMGARWATPRFVDSNHTVVDELTGLIWTKDASLGYFPLIWQEALDYIRDMNRRKAFGYSDWRLPNRKELFSLVSHVNINPALPTDNPFVNIFSGYYWTSTTCTRLPNQAWYVHFGGARVFKGMKHGSYMVWPVRGGTGGVLRLARTGQKRCFSEHGEVIQCSDTGQDGSLQMGAAWPELRFYAHGTTVIDKLTDLMWTKNANLPSKGLNWQSALDVISSMNGEKAYGHRDWRLPNARELESLTDMGSHTPALPLDHPFEQVQECYWTGTTSVYDPRYAWVLYMGDGAVGVGYKEIHDFCVWPVRGGSG